MEKIEQVRTSGFDPLGLELAFQPPPDREYFENAVQSSAFELLDDPFAKDHDWETMAENLETEAGSAHSFKGCTASEKNILIDAADRSLHAVRHAASFIGSAYGRPDRMSADTKRLLLEHFHTVKHDDLRFILTRLMRIAKAIEHGIAFKAERSCPATPSGMECGYANTSMWFGGSGDVRLCFDTRPGHCNFASSAAPRQERILIHEVSHRYVGINDKAYHHLPAYKTLSPSQAMDNADSYAFFAVDARATLSEAEDLDMTAEALETQDFDESVHSEGSDETLEESGLLDEEWFDEEGDTFSPQQEDFRDRVLAAHIASKKRKPFSDLDPGRLAKIPGTDVETLASTAEAAGRILTAANAALREAQARGDADALRTRHIGISSGYRSFAHQRRRWMELFPKYYRQSQDFRRTLPGGEHSAAAVAYMLRPRKAGGFGLAGNIGAPGYSNHQSGIAVDFFQHRTPGHAISNSTASAARARWRASWFYRWLKENAQRFNFKQLETEEWHWEYQGGALPAQANRVAVNSSEAGGAKLWTYQSAIIRAPVSLFLPPAALGSGQLKVLLYVHGLLGPCPKLSSVPDGFISGEQFALGKIVTGSGLPMAVIVPLLQEGKDRNWQARGLDTPGQINALIDEGMTEITRRLGRPARLSDLVIAGHSRGFGVIYPLARSRDPARRQGALAQLRGLWMLDASYGTVPLRELYALASVPGGPEVKIVYRTGSPTDKFQGKKTGGRAQLMPVPSSISHCALPAKLLGSLLAGLPVVKGSPRAEEIGRYGTWENEPWTATEWTEAGLDTENENSGGPYDFVEPEEDDRESDYEMQGSDEMDWLDYEADAGEAHEDAAYQEAFAGQMDETMEQERHKRMSFMGEETSGMGDEVLDSLNQFLEHEAGSDVSLAGRLKGSANFLLGPTLHQGARGNGVIALQRALVSLSYPVVIDGNYSAQLEKAVRQFQLRTALSADGVVGPKTKAAIAAALARQWRRT
ncbi:peptidoglycan-binding protein [Rhizobium grahamii]|uniref:Penicillin-resistant dd-carboxypeptidase-like protein n=1 Tax=Rhizobium grahamii CCGE 502 TaxID=990285 RepID=S3HF08_9HYPH|nr:peptidoglycan-binding protein [Rhizobium grahamii]EPE96650.1 penicillin-resistant dd-carboxypeptidase-like protein [Rhizobium grahamii CCGE 502]